MRTTIATLFLLVVLIQDGVPFQSPEMPSNNRALTKLTPWLGTWEGEARNEIAGRPATIFNVQLLVAETDIFDRWTWQITYVDARNKSVRNYELALVDEPNGAFVLDEKNGVRLPATLFQDSLHFHFTIEDQTLWSRYRLLKNGSDEIEYELIAASNKGTETSGTSEFQVVGLQPISRQFATLTRSRDKSHD